MTTENNSAVNIGDVSGSITGSNIAGRDIIQNIIVVGQFLDFAKVEGLLPQPAALPDLATLDDNLDQALRDHLGSELTTATATAGTDIKMSRSLMIPKSHVWVNLPK